MTYIFTPNTLIESAKINSNFANIGNSNLSTTAGDIGGAWLSFTPTINNLTLGSGSKYGYYTQIGKTIHFNITVTCAANTVFGASNLTIDPPVTPATRYTQLQSYFLPIGNVTMHDAGTAVYMGATFFDYATSSGKIFACVYGTGGTYATRNNTTTGTPFTIVANDTLAFSGTYEAA